MIKNGVFVREKKKSKGFFFKQRPLKNQITKESGNLALEISLQFVWQTKLSGELFLHNLKREKNFQVCCRSQLSDLFQLNDKTNKMRTNSIIFFFLQLFCLSLFSPTRTNLIFFHLYFFLDKKTLFQFYFVCLKQTFYNILCRY